MDDVSLGGAGGRGRWARRAAAAAALGLAAAGVVSQLHTAKDHRPRVTQHAPDAGARHGGPVQLAGLGPGAARRLNHSAAHSTTITK
jgi:hypothetical protein